MPLSPLTIPLASIATALITRALVLAKGLWRLFLGTRRAHTTLQPLIQTAAMIAGLPPPLLFVRNEDYHVRNTSRRHAIPHHWCDLRA